MQQRYEEKQNISYDYIKFSSEDPIKDLIYSCQDHSNNNWYLFMLIPEFDNITFCYRRRQDKKQKPGAK